MASFKQRLARRSYRPVVIRPWFVRDVYIGDRSCRGISHDTLTQLGFTPVDMSVMPDYPELDIAKTYPTTESVPVEVAMQLGFKITDMHGDTACIATPDAPALPCPMCQARGKTWRGADPTCGFLTGVFSADNWNCATESWLSEYVRNLEHPAIVRTYDTPYEEAWTAIVDLTVVAPAMGATSLYVQWYKSRGRTDVINITYPDQLPRPIILDECLAICEAFAALPE